MKKKNALASGYCYSYCMRCKWYSVCPMRRFEREGRIGNEWNRKYCSGNYEACVRYRKEEAGIPHQDILLPDGSFLPAGGDRVN